MIGAPWFPRLSHAPMLALFLLLAACGGAPSGGPAAPGQGEAAVASAHPAATAAGLEVLAAGGNAFDAAVAVSAALAVVEPHSSGLGGGGFWLLHRQSDGYQVMVDGRERAPLAATADMFLDAQGRHRRALSLDGALAAAIPGEPAALDHIAGEYGRLPLARSLAPAIRLAREGFEVYPHLSRLAGMRRRALAASPAAAALFLPGGEPIAAGRVLRQPDLAKTLQRLADHGAGGFYAGPTAERLIETVRAEGGIWSARDLAAYRVVERAPARGSHRGIDVVSASLPSSGGIVLIEALNILSGYDLAALPEAERVHLIIEAMRRAYRDRAAYLGDPDYVDVPVRRLTAPHYAAGLRAGISRNRATPSGLLPQAAPGPGGRHTTHFSVIDGDGNRVAATLSINLPFGSGLMAPGTGVLLNDEMDDFAAQPGAPNAYGLIGSAANAIEPGKRPLSSMTPTFLEGSDRIAVLGTPGGSRIISMVLLSTLAFVEGADPATMVGLPRYHHQYLPDVVQHEPGAFSDATRRALAAMGHGFEDVGRRYGDMQVLVRESGSGRTRGASDPRGIGRASVMSPAPQTMSRSLPAPDPGAAQR